MRGYFKSIFHSLLIWFARAAACLVAQPLPYLTDVDKARSSRGASLRAAVNSLLV